MTKSNIKRNGL